MHTIEIIIDLIDQSIDLKGRASGGQGGSALPPSPAGVTEQDEAEPVAQPPLKGGFCPQSLASPALFSHEVAERPWVCETA